MSSIEVTFIVSAYQDNNSKRIAKFNNRLEAEQFMTACKERGSKHIRLEMRKVTTTHQTLLEIGGSK